MKINTTKLVVGVLAVAGVASLVGSISGTVAWFQYNTRAVAEFEGTTAQCTEFLEVRTVKSGLPIKAKVGEKPTSSMTAGEKYLVTADDKIYTAIDATTTDAGVDADKTAEYDDGTTLWKYSTSEWVADSEKYGNWVTRLDNTAIKAAAGRTDNKLSPVTMPFADTITTPDQDAGDLYGHPICGYEKYDTGTYHWEKAKASDYMAFSLQFRVLDIDGEGAAAGKEALLAKDLWLTDLTIAQKGTTKSDISSAVRVHISNGSDKNYILAKAGSSDGGTITTATKGNLDLNLNGDVDNTLDVPGSNYSFNTDAGDIKDLVYGSDKGKQMAYNVTSSDASFYPTNDGVGHLSGGKALGTTDANTSGTTESTWLTLNFKIWLEGWQELTETNAKDTDTTTHPKIWSDSAYIGSEFNVGMSFAVSALD